MTKRTIAIWLLLCCTRLSAQSQDQLTGNRIQFKKNGIYFVCRGTKSKSALIAHQFNIADTNITHSGIGFFQNGRLWIYHVTDITDKTTSALLVDSLESFIKSDDVYYLSIWECKSDEKEVLRFRKICEEYKKQKIIFDPQFQLNNDNNLYCSEFCALVLKKTNARKFNFQPSSFELHNTFYQVFLDRKTLIFFPVDFFERTGLFKKIFESKVRHPKYAGSG